MGKETEFAPSSIEVLDLNYPGLRQAISQANSVVTSKFLGLRSDLASVNPPILILNEGVLSTAAKKSLSMGPQEYRNQSSFIAQVEIIRGVIYLSSDSIKKELERGKWGSRNMTRILAEEYFHAYTVVSGKGTTRVGLVEFKYTRHPHGLIPGQIYIDDPTTFSYEDIKPLYIPRRAYRLSEALTKVAVHLSMKELLPDLKKDYPFIGISFEKKETIFRGKNVLNLRNILNILLEKNYKELNSIFTKEEIDKMSLSEGWIFSFDITKNKTEFPLKGSYFADILLFDQIEPF